MVLNMARDTHAFKKRPKNFTQYTLGLHKEVWANINTDQYLHKMREEWEHKHI